MPWRESESSEVLFRKPLYWGRRNHGAPQKTNRKMRLNPNGVPQHDERSIAALWNPFRVRSKQTSRTWGAPLRVDPRLCCETRSGLNRNVLTRKSLHSIARWAFGTSVVSWSSPDTRCYGNGWPVGPKTQLFLLTIFTNMANEPAFVDHKDVWYDETNTAPLAGFLWRRSELALSHGSSIPF